VRFAILVLALSSAGCQIGLLGVVAGAADSNGVYRPGTIAHELGDGSVRTLGCLDVGLRVIDRDAAWDNGTSLIELHVGNRCGHPEALDFSKIRIEGTGPDGEIRTVALDDPRSEIVRLEVGPGERGKEKVRMNTSVGLVQLSFDLAEIAPDAPHSRPAPLAFRRNNACSGPWVTL
jgi:hypothetical protein